MSCKQIQVNSYSRQKIVTMIVNTHYSVNDNFLNVSRKEFFRDIFRRHTKGNKKYSCVSMRIEYRYTHYVRFTHYTLTVGIMGFFFKYFQWYSYFSIAGSCFVFVFAFLLHTTQTYLRHLSENYFVSFMFHSSHF